MIDNQHFHSSTASQCSATGNTHTHASDESPEKTPGDRADNWLLDKTSDLYRGETESQATSCQVHSEKQTKKEQIYTYTDTPVCMLVCMIVSGPRTNQSYQPAVRYTQQSKQNTHTCVSVYVCLYAERERISVTLVTTAAQGCPRDLDLCARMCAGTISLISLL